MESENRIFGSVAGGVFVGGLALVLVVAFWQVALGLLAVALTLFALVWAVIGIGQAWRRFATLRWLVYMGLGAGGLYGLALLSGFPL